MDLFIDFLDGVNAVFLGNPALRAGTMVGNIVGMVPLMSTQIAGNALSTLSGVGSAAMSVTRTRAYFKECNERVSVLSLPGCGGPWFGLVC